MKTFRPFETDGCTLFPDGNYRQCCVEHDKAYHRGGPIQYRRLADLELQLCVAAQGAENLAGRMCERFHATPIVRNCLWLGVVAIQLGYVVLGAAMYAGVRVGGARWHRFGWQWGFGEIRDDERS